MMKLKFGDANWVLFEVHPYQMAAQEGPRTELNLASVLHCASSKRVRPVGAGYLVTFYGYL